jgi:hypothetical protein
MAVALTAGFATSPATAHPTSPAPAVSNIHVNHTQHAQNVKHVDHRVTPSFVLITQQDATNLCTWFRPYQTGYVIQTTIITDADIYCVTIYSAGNCLGYDVRGLYGQWYGPDGVHDTSFPVPWC